jgi:phage gp29-like protein
MATDPKAAKPQAPKMGEIAPPESAMYPLQLQSMKAAPFIEMLQPEDTVLASKGGIDNLRIYKELLRDDQVASTWQQRRLGLTKCDTIVEPGGEDALSKAAAEALEEELEELNWDDVTDKMLYSVFYGWGVAEVIWRPNGSRVSFDKIVVRDRARFRFNRIDELYLWTMKGGWVLMPDRKFWCARSGGDHSDDPYGLGLAHSLYWPVFFKRNDIKFWLVFLEKFGMPTTIASLPPGATQDPEQRQKAIEMLQQIATDAGLPPHRAGGRPQREGGARQQDQGARLQPDRGVHQ